MPERINSPESERVPEEAVIELLNTKGTKDPAALELLGTYVDQCHAEVDAVCRENDDPIVQRKAQLQADFKIASIYVKTLDNDLFNEGLRLLREVHHYASENEATKDLAEEALALAREV